MWKKTESREEHGSCGLCHEILPSAAPHDMAGWQRASQKLYVSQTLGLATRSELFILVWRQRMEKEGLFSPSHCQVFLQHGHSCCATSSLVNSVEGGLIVG